MENLVKYKFISGTDEIGFEEIQKIINYLSAPKTEEAILNSLFAAESMTGYQGRTIEALPKERVLKLLEEAGKITLERKD